MQRSKAQKSLRAKRATFTKICIVAQKNFAQSNFLSAVKMKNVLLSNFSYALICLVNSRKIASKYIITFCSYERIAQSEIFLCDSTCFFLNVKFRHFEFCHLCCYLTFILVICCWIDAWQNLPKESVLDEAHIKCALY